MLRRVLAFAMVLALAASCDIGPIRRVGPKPTPPSGPEPTVDAGPIFEERRAVLPVQPGMTVHMVEFADRDNGYALAVSCGPEHTPTGGPAQQDNQRCVGELAATTDGGRTWTARQHPAPVASNHQIYALDGSTVALFTEDTGYYLSLDGARTFAKVTEPIPSVRYGLFCEPSPCGVFQFTPIGPATRVPAQPDLPGEIGSVVEGADGGIWAASLAADGKPYTASSSNLGQSWQRHEVLAPDGVRLQRVELQVSADGSDVWLLGFHGGEPNLFPSAIWYYEPGGWARRAVGGHPPEGFVTPAGGQVLAAAGPAGMGVLDSGVANGEYQKRPDWPNARDHVDELLDGTLVARSGGRLWLGLGNGTQRRWISIITTTS